MRRSRINIAAIIATSAFAVSCGKDAATPVSPNGPRLAPSQKNLSVRPGSCFNAATLSTLIRTMLGAGHPALNAALAKLAAMIVYVAQNKIPQAQTAARDLIAFLNSQILPTTPPSQKAQIQATIDAILCFVGLPPDTYIVVPSPDPQVVLTAGGGSGLNIPGGAVTVPTILTITTLDPGGPSGVITKLDQYPTFINISASSPLSKPTVVAICLGVTVPVDVFNRLRLGHQSSTSGFQITPPADPSFLGCPTSLASASNSKVPGWLRSLASIVLPKAAYARQALFATGGVGGSAIDFSPFDAVDPMLFATGGVGGSAIDFQRNPISAPKLPSTAPSTTPGAPTPGTAAPSTQTNPALPSAIGGPTLKSIVPGSRSNTVVGGVCTSVDATVGTAVDPLCRPVITLATAKGTIMQNVPVSWAVTAGGGTIAPDTITSQTCGIFGSTASTATNALGKAGVCWTLGINAGTNTVSATPSAGGDAPAGVIFSPAHTQFTAMGIKIDPTASATGASVPFDGLAHAGSGTCTNGLTPALTYSTTDGLAPTNNGSYTLTVTCGAGSNTYNTATATATISISQITPVVAVSCPVAVVYTGAAQTPCSATVTAAGGLSLTPTPTYAANTDVGSATASYAFAATGNYAAASGSANFSITQAPSVTTVTCTVTTAVFNGSAQTPCSATVTGAGGLSLTPAPTYAANTSVGTATASYTFGGDANHAGSNASASFSITAAASVTAVSCPASLVYTGAPLTPCTVAVSGAGGLNLAPAPAYGGNTNVGTATASYTYAGDANHSGSAGTASFAIAKAGSSTTLTCPATVTYTGAIQNPCTASVSGASLSAPVAVAYAPGTVRDAGAYTANASYAGDANHNGSSAAPAGFSIGKLPATATAGSGTMLLGAAVPSLPCTLNGILAADASAVLCTTSTPSPLVAGVNVTTPKLTPASPLDYQVAAVNGTLTVSFVQSGCFATPITASMPSSSSNSNPKRGSSVTVKCRLVEATGRPVVTAKGNLLVQDMGSNGSGTPATVFTGTNVFGTHNDGDFDADDGFYTYALSTSPVGFVSGHYYFVTATWSDGSKSTGWFFLR